MGMGNLLELEINYFIMQKKISIIWITICWFIAAFLLGVILGLIAENNASSGEQKLFTYIGISIITGSVGVVLINILFLLLGNNRNERRVSIFFLVIALIILMSIMLGTIFDKYDIVEQTRYSGSNEIDIKKEYYVQNESKDNIRHIRSEKFWKNGKKDSLWTVYAKDGIIISQRKYNNGELVKTIQ